MNSRQQPGEIRMVPVSQIEVINPRERNGRVFNEIVDNIKTIGLKKPIVVTPRVAAGGTEKYLLVCGEGRLKAFRSLGEATIPALVVSVSDEDAFVMSLTENIARRQCRPLERLAGRRQSPSRPIRAAAAPHCHRVDDVRALVRSCHLRG